MIGGGVKLGTSDMPSALVRIGGLIDENMDILDAVLELELDQRSRTSEQLSSRSGALTVVQLTTIPSGELWRRMQTLL